MLKAAVITLCLIVSTIINADQFVSELNLEQFFKDKGLARIDYKKLPTDHAWVKASINRENGYFIIHAAEGATAIHQESAKEINLVQGNEAANNEATGWENRLVLALFR